jgi:hypothetical protein
LFSHFLFRDAEQFWRTLLDPMKEPVISDNDKPLTGRPVRTDKVTVKVASATQMNLVRVQDLQRKLLRAARSIGNCSVEDLWRKHYGLMKQLTKLDASAIVRLKAQLASIKPSTQQKKIRSISVHPEDDARACKVREAAEELYASSDKPERVSANRLSRRIGWNVVCLNKSQFPATRRAVEDLMESNWFFYARRIVWAMLYLPGGSNAAIRAASGIEHHRAFALITHFRDIDTSTLLVKGTVALLLKQHGVERNWAGPCPDRKFPPSGRAFYRERI